jgi:proliferating cell nuclear antigen
MNDEASIVFDDSGLSTKIVDPAHVGMAHITIPKDSFVEYDVESRKELPVDVERMNDVTKLAKDADDLTLFLNEDKNMLEMSFGSLKRSMQLLASGVSSPKVPKLDASVTAEIKTSYLKLAARASGQVTDHVRIEATKDAIKFLAKGDTDDTCVDIEKDKIDKYDFTGNAKCIYSLDYFSQILGVVSADTITIMLNTDIPLQMKFNQNGIDTFFLLAPRIENE